VVTSIDRQTNHKPATKGWLESDVTRRSFVSVSGALAAGAAIGTTFFTVNSAAAQDFGDPILVETDAQVDIKYSVCLACHSACGVRCKVVNGVLDKIDGNPYHPNTLEPHLPYATDPAIARTVPGHLCAKGQAGIQVLYNPLRIKQPLKRVGDRGAGQWQAISWDQAFSEIGDQLTPLRDLATNVDPSAPELGPMANKVVFCGGRNEHGQKEFTDRFWGNGFGTINKRHDHTSICETSHHVGYALATGNGDFGDKAATKGSTDLANCECVLWFGTDPMSANFPFVAQARKLSEMIENGGKLAVVDPRFNVTASKADWWLPVVPGTDAALALALGRYIIDNSLYNTDFLQRPHDAASNPTSELNTTDSTFLVKIVGGHATAYLRSDEAGLGGTNQDFVVWSGGGPAQYDSVDTADLLPGMVMVSGILCKTSFELYAEQTQAQTVDAWATICGIAKADIEALAVELSSHGRKVSIEHYRGPVGHTNGTYTSWSIINLNTLFGNFNWKGGHVFGGSHWHETGGKAGNKYSPKTVVGGVSPTGIQVTRVLSDYENTAEFANNGYPARRPWFPFANHFNYQEVIPSIEDAYPYSVGALILYWNDIAYSTPAGKATVQRVLADQAKIPLIVSIDIEMGETTAYADYILPDSTYLERWSTPHVGSAINTKTSGVRQPVVGSFDAQMNYTPFLPNTKTLEDILIGLGKSMGLPMDLLDENGGTTPLDRAWDYHSQLINNIGDEGGGPGMDYVLARGGRFEDFDQLYDGDKMAHRFKTRFYLFNETLAQSRDSMTGVLRDGFAKSDVIADTLDNPIAGMDTDYPLTLITYKQSWHSMARTASNPWLMSIQSENFVEMNSVDAKARKLRTGDEVRITSASLPAGLVGRVQVTETLRPDVVAIAHSFGHWEMSSKSHTVDGVASDSDPSRAKGIAANPLMRADPLMQNVTLQDKVGGSASYSDTRVQITKL